jgi:uncharacterized membrane protein
MAKYIIKVCDLSVFRWTKNDSELWYIAILQKKSHLKNSVFWFSLVYAYMYVIYFRSYMYHMLHTCVVEYQGEMKND